MRDDGRPTPPPSRDFGYSLEWLETSPGARKEKLRRLDHYAADAAARPTRLGSRPAPPYAELHLASAFSFLDGASQPEDLVAQAARLGLPAVALVDRNGVYGAPRFYQAAREAGIKALVGAELEMGMARAGMASTHPFIRAPATGGRRCGQRGRALQKMRLTLLVENRTGYRNLCRLLTAAARDRPKGEALADWAMLAKHAAGLHCLTGGDEGLLARTLESDGSEAARALTERLADLYPGRLHVELQRHHRRPQEARNRVLLDLAGSLRLPLLATNGVRHARAADKPLYDVLCAIRSGRPLDRMGRRLAANRERHLKSATEMAELFADLPQALTASAELAERLDFTLADLGYRFPDYPLPAGETPGSFLRTITWNEARARFRPLTGRAQRQIARELDLIDKLDLAGYFLIVWDLVQFCKRERIMVQGRGSAANSAVCYALSITAVDPVKMELLFERFLSEERGEWPDIDLDLPSGDQREKVIQYVYRRYGPHGAAMTANVITYRNRSAARETAKALGFSSEQQGRLSKQLGRWHYDVSRGDPKSLPDELTAAGFDPESERVKLFAHLWQRIHNLPRHLGQHSGGMVIAAGRLDEVVPLEPAAMEDRVVVQWDKDDCADLGIIKVDLLGLGMLQALEEAIPMIRIHEGVEVDLAHLPPDDPETYEMMRRADTVGVFQIESRAQMASLPRNQPERFYDLVIQVAIIRPGPIVGGMVHPYFERRQGRQPVTYAHPCLEPILERTLGVPIFQEQILRMAMAAAGFTGGEAEELRRAMGFKRSVERMQEIEQRLRHGMDERGIRGDTQEQVVQSITSFALYGFPESHAASFALIAYASAYLKQHHPTAFYTSLLNAWPMGFYHPATLVKDAERHGVEVLPIDVNHSAWVCSWESVPPRGDSRDYRESAPPPAKGALRLGLRYLRGLRRATGEGIERERRRRVFTDAEDLRRRCALRPDELTRLAQAGALASLGASRRQALWQVARVSRPSGPLFEQGTDPAERSPLREMSPAETTSADYQTTGLTTGPHPLAHLRRELDRRGILSAARLVRMRHGAQVRVAGSVIVRQRPGTAKGMLFITLEDETGMVQAIVTPDLLRRHRRILVGSAGLVVAGRLQRRDGSLSVKAETFTPLPLDPVPSHDFH